MANEMFTEHQIENIRGQWESIKVESLDDWQLLTAGCEWHQYRHQTGVVVRVSALTGHRYYGGVCSECGMEWEEAARILTLTDQQIFEERYPILSQHIA